MAANPSFNAFRVSEPASEWKSTWRIEQERRRAEEAATARLIPKLLRIPQPSKAKQEAVRRALKGGYSGPCVKACGRKARKDGMCGNCGGITRPSRAKPKIQCSACPTRVQPTAASKADGLCGPCRQLRQYHADIEASRKLQRDRYAVAKLAKRRTCSDCGGEIGHAGKTGKCLKCVNKLNGGRHA